MNPFSKKIKRTKFVERKISYNLSSLIPPIKFPVFVLRDASADWSDILNILCSIVKN